MIGCSMNNRLDRLERRATISAMTPPDTGFWLVPNDFETHNGPFQSFDI